jgi:hypothetical protein
MRKLLLCLLLVSFLGVPSLAAEDKGWGGSGPPSITSKDVEGKRIGLLERLRMRRKYGVSIGSVRETAKQLKEAGEWEKPEYVDENGEIDREAQVLRILEELTKDNPKLQNASAPDWDAIFEFLVKLIELLMMFGFI